MGAVRESGNSLEGGAWVGGVGDRGCGPQRPHAVGSVDGAREDVGGGGVGGSVGGDSCFSGSACGNIAGVGLAGFGGFGVGFMTGSAFGIVAGGLGFSLASETTGVSVSCKSFLLPISIFAGLR